MIALVKQYWLNPGVSCLHYVGLMRNEWRKCAPYVSAGIFFYLPTKLLNAILEYFKRQFLAAFVLLCLGFCLVSIFCHLGTNTNNNWGSALSTFNPHTAGTHADDTLGGRELRSSTLAWIGWISCITITSVQRVEEKCVYDIQIPRWEYKWACRAFFIIRTYKSNECYSIKQLIDYVNDGNVFGILKRDFLDNC